jgi:DNA-nicking Smr family endonuclease
MPVQMDRREYKRLKRGKRDPEARLDLHGMTMDRAHPALTRFILSAQASGHRLVLVITGKGRGDDDGGAIPNPKGVLRHKVPAWLGLPPLAQAVLQITPAHQRHGGGGAYYVYLRRGR